MPKKILIVPIFILTTGLVFFVYINQFSGLKPSDNNKNESELYKDNNECMVDADCRVAATRHSQRPCCSLCGREAINEKTLTFRNSWDKSNCKNPDCPTFSCVYEKEPEVKCIEDTCAIEWVE